MAGFKNFIKRNLFFILAVLLLCDIGFSVYQYFHQALDGDIAGIVLPSAYYSDVLSDPFGFSVISGGESYSGTNRFFAHATMSLYYKTVPFLLQLFTGPLDSVYLATSMAKTFMHFLLVFLLGAYISGRSSLRSVELLAAMLLVTPLFHNGGSGMYLGFIDYSPTYAFFWALPLALILLFLLPFFLEVYHGRRTKHNPSTVILLMMLGVVLAFNGPVSVPVLLIICPLLYLYGWRKSYAALKEKGRTTVFRAWKGMPPLYMIVLPWIILLCLYSFYIGTFNAENAWQAVSLPERFSRMPAGLLELLTGKAGVPFLLSAVVVNVFLIWALKINDGRRSLLIKSFLVTVLLGILFIALLPLGGYREYRPNIVRLDTAMPVLLGFLLWFGLSSFHLIFNSGWPWSKYYLSGIIVFLAIFILNDPARFGHYDCERNALEQLAASGERIVKLPSDCPVMDWQLKTDPGKSVDNCTLLRIWGVVEEDKLYYQEAD